MCCWCLLCDVRLLMLSFVVCCLGCFGLVCGVGVVCCVCVDCIDLLWFVLAVSPAVCFGMLCYVVFRWLLVRMCCLLCVWV